jgi:NodT family efflux transporter outer membrane factor (OMF) lipoprotein
MKTQGVAVPPYRLAGLAGAALLAGCAAVGPDFRPPVPAAPAHWEDWHGGAASLSAATPVLAASHAGPTNASTAAPAPAPPWGGLGDATLATLESEARGANSDLGAAALHLAEARASRQSAQSQSGPQAAGRAGVSRERLSETGSSTRLVDAIASGAQREALIDFVSTPFSVYQAGFDASWELDFWGRVRRSVESARAQEAQAGALLAQARLVVAAEVAREYFTLRSQQRQRAELARSLTAADSALELLAAQVRGGLADDSQRLQAQQDVTGLRARVQDLAAAEAATTNRLTLLCGAHPGAFNDRLAAPGGGDMAMAAAPPELHLGQPADFLRRRPDVAAAEHRLAAATADIGVAVADLYPRIAIGASAGFESVHANDFADWGSRQWTLGPTLSLPVFDQGRRRATVELRELQQQEAAVAFQQAVLQAWHDVDDAVTAYAAARVDLDAARRKQDASAEAVALAEARWRHGLTDERPALDARRRLAEACAATAGEEGRVAVQFVAVTKALAFEGAGDAPGSVTP